MDNVEKIISMTVAATISELKRNGMLRDRYSVLLKDTEPVLREYFAKKNNKEIESFLITHSDDPYIDILYLHYRDNVTIERIAECLEKDVSTIKRNKKRLIMSIYDLIN